MDIRKLNTYQLTKDQFNQMLSIEQNCGLEPYTPEMLLDCIENLDTYACMDGNAVAGFITIHPASRKLSDGLYIANLNVAKAYRRQGIAQRLMVAACSCYADSHKGQFVTLDVSKDNTAARKLYEKLGFSITDIPSRNGDTDVVMVAELGQLCKETL